MESKQESWKDLVCEEVTAGMVRAEHFEAMLGVVLLVVGLQQLQ